MVISQQTNTYKLIHCGWILCHNLRRCHGVHTKGLENPTETLSMYDHVKIKLMYVENEKYVLFQEPIGHLHKIITIN